MDALAAALESRSWSRYEACLLRNPDLARKPKTVLAAAQGAAVPALEILVARGADLNAAYRGYRPLHALIQERPHHETEPSPERLACMDWLLAHGADPELHGAWPPARALLVAAFGGIAAFVDRLLAAGARRDIFTASALGDERRVEKDLAEDPALATARDGGVLTALQCCAASRMEGADGRDAERRMRIARVLLDAGADVRAKSRSWSHDVDTVYFAVSARNGPMLDLLLNAGADPGSALASALWVDLDLAGLALERGARINETMADDRPILNELIRWGQVRPALWLLERGADPNRPDARGWTAVHQAAARGNARLLEAVVKAGGDTVRRDAKGVTPRAIARAKGWAKVRHLFS